MSFLTHVDGFLFNVCLSDLRVQSSDYHFSEHIIIEFLPQINHVIIYNVTEIPEIYLKSLFHPFMLMLRTDQNAKFFPSEAFTSCYNAMR